MPFSTYLLRCVIEVGTCLGHCYTSYDLSYSDKANTERNGESIHIEPLIGWYEARYDDLGRS